MTDNADLMEMLFRAYVVVTQPDSEDRVLATCAACNVVSDPNTFRWCISSDVRNVYTLAVDHIREHHLVAAGLTIDAMRRTLRPGADESTTRHRLERLRLGLMVLRDQLAEVTRQDVVLKPVATHGRVLALATTAKVLLATDKLLASGGPLPVQVRLERKAADVG